MTKRFRKHGEIMLVPTDDLAQVRSRWGRKRPPRGLPPSGLSCQ